MAVAIPGSEHLDVAAGVAEVPVVEVDDRLVLVGGVADLAHDRAPLRRQGRCPARTVGLRFSKTWANCRSASAASEWPSNFTGSSA